MNRWFSSLPIGRKLFSINLGIMVIMTLIVVSALLWLTSSLAGRESNFSTYKAITAYFSNPSITNQILFTPDKFKHHMAWLSDLPDIGSAVLVRDNQLIYGFSKTEVGQVIKLSENPPGMSDYHRITLNQESPRLELFLQRKVAFSHQIYLGAIIAIVIILISSAALISFSSRIARRALILPIEHLRSIAELVTSREDFTARVQKFHDDEIGVLVDRFNRMLTRIETRDHQLLAETNKAQTALQRAQDLSSETTAANKRLEFEVHVRTKIERKLTDFQGYLNSIINSMPSALIALDEHFFVTLWNKKASDLSGTQLESALGYSIEEAFPLLQTYIEEISHAFIEEELKVIEKVNFLTSDNKNLLLELVIFPLSRSESRGVVIRIDDITDRFKLEEVIVQTEKMMSVGGLAAGMAHEINNPLSAIIQGVQNINRRLSADMVQNQKTAEQIGINLKQMNEYLAQRKVLHFLTNISEAGERAAQIVTNMLQFSRQTNHVLIEEPMHDLVNQAIDIVGNEQFLRSGRQTATIKITRDIPKVDIKVPCVRQEIEQVLINLMKNGAQAIESKQQFKAVEGELTVTLAYTQSHCVIKVADNGIGMSQEIKKRIFEPFFTTKDIGLGTGLGLSVSYFIISSHHNGSLEVSSEPDKGTEFTICLPLN